MKSQLAASSDFLKQVYRACAAPNLFTAFVIATVLLPNSAVGQTYTYPTVTYQAGQWQTSIPGHRQEAGLVNVPYNVPSMYCFSWAPDAAWIKGRIQFFDSQNNLKTALDALEAAPQNPQASDQVTQLGLALNQFVGALTIRLSTVTYSHERPAATLAMGWPNGTSYQADLHANCLLVADGAKLALEVRKVVRAYLGLPPPQN